MMAAATAAAERSESTITGKKQGLGKKLRITGGGRCNLTNATLSNRQLLPRYGEASKFLFSAFTQHSVSDSLNFLPSKQSPH